MRSAVRATVVVLFLLGLALHGCSAVEDFVPTDEWQVVKEGQAVPPGLWVRMDMTTGVKTARNLEKTSAPSTTQDSLVLVSSPEASSPPVASASPAPSRTEPVVVRHIEKDEQRKPAAPTFAPGQFRSLDALEASGLSVQPSEFELMAELLDVIVHNETGVRDVTEALELLEEFSHSIDNAVDLVSAGAFDVVLSLLNRSSDVAAFGPTGSEKLGLDAASAASAAPAVPGAFRTRFAADPATAPASVLSVPLPVIQLSLPETLDVQRTDAWLLGTAAQNNGKAQQWLLQHGAVDSLLRKLQQIAADDGRDAASLAHARLRSLLRVKVLFALSSLLRQNPAAQALFHSSGGFDALRDIIAAPASSVPESLQRLHLQAQKKALGVVRDLLVDVTFNSAGAAKGSGAGATSADAVVSLTPAVNALGSAPFCDALARLLAPTNAAASPIDTDEGTERDMDSLREQALRTAQLLLTSAAATQPAESCRPRLSQPDVAAGLDALRKQLGLRLQTANADLEAAARDLPADWQSQAQAQPLRARRHKATDDQSALALLMDEAKLLQMAQEQAAALAGEQQADREQSLQERDQARRAALEASAVGAQREQELVTVLQSLHCALLNNNGQPPAPRNS